MARRRFARLVTKLFALGWELTGVEFGVPGAEHRVEVKAIKPEVFLRPRGT